MAGLLSDELYDTFVSIFECFFQFLFLYQISEMIQILPIRLNCRFRLRILPHHPSSRRDNVDDQQGSPFGAAARDLSFMNCATGQKHVASRQCCPVAVR